MYTLEVLCFFSSPQSNLPKSSFVIGFAYLGSQASFFSLCVAAIETISTLLFVRYFSGLELVLSLSSSPFIGLSFRCCYVPWVSYLQWNVSFFVSVSEGESFPPLHRC